eukprot:CFRG5071T1
MHNSTSTGRDSVTNLDTPRVETMCIAMDLEPSGTDSESVTSLNAPSVHIERDLCTEVDMPQVENEVKTPAMLNVSLSDTEGVAAIAVDVPPVDAITKKVDDPISNILSVVPVEQLTTQPSKAVNSQPNNNSDSAKIGNINRKERLALLTSSRYSWFLALAGYPAIFAFSVIFFYLSMATIGDYDTYVAELKSDSKDGLSRIFMFACVSNVCTMVMVLLLIAFFVKYWEEPEIRSRHHGFIIHFCTAALAGCILGVVNAAITLEITGVEAVTPEGEGSTLYRNLIFFTRGGINLCGHMVLSAVICRMRFMFIIFHSREMGPNYWMGTLAHIVLFFLSTISYGTCEYNAYGSICSTAKLNSGGLCYVLILSIQYTYYLVYTRKASIYFVDWEGNLRCFIVFSLITWGGIIYTMAVPDGRVQVAYLGWYIVPFQTWLFAIDNFLFVVVRVLSRKYGKYNLLAKVDLEGAYFRNHENAKGLVDILENDETRDMFVQYAESRHCPEQVEFLLAVQSCTRISPSENRVSIETQVKDIINIYVRIDSDKEINLPQIVRERLLTRVEDNNYREVTTLFAESYDEISCLVSHNLLLTFLGTPAYRAYAEKQEDQNKLLLSLYNAHLVHSRDTYLGSLSATGGKSKNRSLCTMSEK